MGPNTIELYELTRDDKSCEGQERECGNVAVLGVIVPFGEMGDSLEQHLCVGCVGQALLEAFKESDPPVPQTLRTWRIERVQ